MKAVRVNLSLKMSVKIEKGGKILNLIHIVICEVILIRKYSRRKVFQILHVHSVILRVKHCVFATKRISNQSAFF